MQRIMTQTEVLAHAAWRKLQLAGRDFSPANAALTPVFRDQFPDLGDEIARHIHDRLGRRNAGLVLR